MIGGGFSLFGFDLFGLSRRDPQKVDDVLKSQAPDTSRKEREADRLSDQEHSESFFWGMYPVY